MTDFSIFVADRPVHIPGNPNAPTPGDPPPTQQGFLAFFDASIHEGEGARFPRRASASRASLAIGAANEWFVDQFWIDPRPVNFGNITERRVVTVSIFSSHRVPHALVAIDFSAVQPGVDLDSAVLPLTIEGLGTIAFDVAAEEEGLASFNADVEFTFDDRSDLVRFIGARIAGWELEPNWVDNLIERQLWHTDVIEAEDSSEQRVALRGAPRIEWEFTFDVIGGDRRRYQNQIWARGAGTWLVPVFTDSEVLLAELPAGSLSIPLESGQVLRFRAGGSVMLIHAGASEVATVESIGSAALNLAGQLGNMWPAGTRVYPALSARLVDPRQTAAYFQNHARGLAVFRTLREVAGDAASEDTYRSEPVMTIEPNWIETPTIDYSRKLFELDPGTGIDYVLDRAELPIPIHAYRWTMTDRPAAEAFRDWCYARRGRFKGLWLPTWNEDLRLALPTSSGNTLLTIELAGAVEFDLPGIHRRDVRIEVAGGGVYYRRIVATSDVDASREAVTLDAGLPVDIDPGNVARISFMHYARLDHDTIEIAWHHGGAADVTLRFRAPKNDV